MKRENSFQSLCNMLFEVCISGLINRMSFQRLNRFNNDLVFLFLLNERDVNYCKMIQTDWQRLEFGMHNKKFRQTSILTNKCWLSNQLQLSIVLVYVRLNLFNENFLST